VFGITTPDRKASCKSRLITEKARTNKMGVVRYMAKELAREIGNKSREFYEFVLPPVDMYLEDDSLVVITDLAGFEKKDIKVALHGNILSIRAEKQEPQKDNVVCRQRPNTIDKKIPLPAKVKDDVSSAKFSQGVLTVKIPIVPSGKQISVE